MFACGRRPRHPWVGESDAGSAPRHTTPVDCLVNLFEAWSKHESVNYIFVGRHFGDRLLALLHFINHLSIYRQEAGVVEKIY